MLQSLAIRLSNQLISVHDTTMRFADPKKSYSVTGLRPPTYYVQMQMQVLRLVANRTSAALSRVMRAHSMSFPPLPLRPLVPVVCRSYCADRYRQSSRVVLDQWLNVAQCCRRGFSTPNWYQEEVQEVA